MTHGNLVSTAAGVMSVVPDIGTKDRYLAYLPLAHVLELCAEVSLILIYRIYLPEKVCANGEMMQCTISAAGAGIGYGSPLTLSDNSAKIKKGTKGDAPELKPTLMTAVPAILDRVREGIRKMVVTNIHVYLFVLKVCVIDVGLSDRGIFRLQQKEE